MALATFKDFCIDATDAAASGRFWAEVLGLGFHPRDNGNARLTGPTPFHTVWINQVPEPKTVKNRIHLDVHGTSIAAVEALGATVIDADTFRWKVLADPDGGEFCLFIRDEPPAYRLYEICVDCADHAATSAWWHQVLGGNRTLDERGFSYLEEIPDAPFDALTFLPVPEPKRAKNRVHLDLVADGIDELLGAGATLLRAHDGDIGWDVLADPEGNEFCVFAPR